MMWRRITATLALAALGLTGLVLAVRLGLGGESRSPDAMLPVLVALASLCVVGLTRTSRPGLASLALILALSTLTVDLASIGREHRPDLDPGAWRWLSIGITLAAIGSVGAAVTYASHPSRQIARWIPTLGAVAIAAMFIVAVWVMATSDQAGVIGDPATPLGDLVLVTRSFLVLTIVFAVLGLFGDARPAFIAGQRRVAVAGDRPPGAMGALRYGSAWLRAGLSELAPGRARARQAAEDERARLARDLHAIVVPDLRRAIRDAEHGGTVDRLAASLREALREVESMIEDRDAVGLDVGGLPAALEALAERVEDRSAVRVTIDILDGRGASRGAPPPAVAAAAARVARLALDNVVRHAPTAHATLALSSSAELVRLSIADDGGGAAPDPGPAAGRRSGGRGLADMVTEAALADASVRIERGARSHGTVVTFEWPVR